MGQIIERHHEPYPVTRATLLPERPAHVPLALEPISPAELHRKIFSYTPDRTGFRLLCQELEQSSDPRAVHMLLYLFDHAADTDAYFKCNTSELFTTLDTTTTISPRERNYPTVLSRFLRNQPNLFILFATEFYTHYLQQHASTTVSSAAVESTNESETARRGFTKLGAVMCLEGNYYSFDQNDRLAPDQLKLFIDQAVEYYCHSGMHFSHQALAHFINRFDFADYAAKRLLEKLRSSPQPSAHVESSLMSLLACLDVAAPSALQEGQFHYLGTSIALEGTPADATAVQRLSIYGEMAVVDNAQIMKGLFSLHDLTPAEHTTFKALVRALELDDLFFQSQAEAHLPVAQQQALATEFSTAYQRYADHPFFKKIRIPLHTFPLKEQVALVRLLRDNNEPILNTIVAAQNSYGKNFIRACILTYAYTGTIDGLIGTNVPAHPRWPDHAIQAQAPKAELVSYQETAHGLECPLDSFIQFVQRAENEAATIYTELLQRYPDLELNMEDIAHGLIMEALTQLRAIDTPEAATTYRHHLYQQEKQNALGLNFFRELAGLSEIPHIQLDHYRRRQNALVHLIEQPDLKAMVLKTLLQKGQLKPIPEIHWRVDRRLVEYQRRFGINMKAWLKAENKGPHKPTILEFGPGSGVAKKDRGKLIKAYEFSIADALYYNVGKYCSRLIDFAKLEETLHIKLNASDRQLVGEMIYKLIYIQEGQESDDQFSYATDRIQQLTDNPETIIALIQAQCRRLNSVTVLPSTISTRTPAGAVLYRKKIKLSQQSPRLKAVRAALAAEPERYIASTQVLAAMPIDPEGTMVGDFSVIEQVEAEQVDIALGARSSVYKRGAEWIKHGVETARTLKPNGIWLDDSLRDNDGYRYRLAELLQLQEALAGQDIHLRIMMGPGFPGEDHVQKKPVPLALVMTKGILPEDKIGSYIAQGYHLVEIDKVVNDTSYVQSLTPTGELADEINAVRPVNSTAS